MENTNTELSLLGPLASLAGQWKGTKGVNIGPDRNRDTETTVFTEIITFTPIGAVKNHEQILYGLRYDTKAFKNDAPYHEENGYWLWEPKAREIYRCFTIPRGIAVLAGGKVAPDAKSFQLEAKAGHPDFGIITTPFLNKEFKTVRYTLDVTVHSQDSFSYSEVTYMEMPGRSSLFDHVDSNTLTRI